MKKTGSTVPVIGGLIAGLVMMLYLVAAAVAMGSPLAAVLTIIGIFVIMVPAGIWLSHFVWRGWTTKDK